MATKLAALLRTSSMGLPELANVLQSKGRNGDTILAHINPKEARLLKRMGGAGTLNPHTGLPEFYSREDEFLFPSEDTSTPDYQPPVGSEEYKAQEGATVGDRTPYITQPIEPATAATPQVPEVTASQGLPDVNLPTQTADMGAYTTPLEGYSFPSTQTTTPAAPSPAGQPLVGIGGVGTDVSATSPAFTETEKEQLKPSLFDKAGDKIDALAKALQTDRLGLLRLGIGGVGALQGAGASRQAQGAAEATQKQIESLGAPYKERGQQLVAMGQAGQLTPAQQQSLAALRAQQAQQLQRMGLSGGGTASMQAEAQIQNLAQQFAQQNIDQGMKLINLSDKYVMDAIKQGYSQSKDATAMSGDFYKTLLSSIPGATQQAAPAQAKVAGT